MILNAVVVSVSVSYKGYCEIEFNHQEEVKNNPSYWQPTGSKLVYLECPKISPGQKIKVSVKYGDECSL